MFSWLAIFFVCTHVQRAQNQAQIPERSIDNSYLEVVPPASQGVLAQKYEIELKLKHPDVTFVLTTQQNAMSRQFFEESSEQIPVQYRDNGAAYISILPLRLGKMDVSISGMSKSGVLFKTSVVLYIGESHQSPTKLLLGSAHPFNLKNDFRLLLSQKWGEAIGIEGLYEGIKKPIQIDPSYVRFAVDSKGGQPVAMVDDATGTIKPLGIGSAVLEVRYGGVVSRTCVFVFATSKAKDDLYRAHCLE